MRGLIGAACYRHKIPIVIVCKLQSLQSKVDVHMRMKTGNKSPIQVVGMSDSSIVRTGKGSYSKCTGDARMSYR